MCGLIESLHLGIEKQKIAKSYFAVQSSSWFQFEIYISQN